jgi:hypothetical protein
MSTTDQPGQQQYAPQHHPQYGQPAPQGMHVQPMPPAPVAGYGQPMGPAGKIRGTGIVILLSIVTLGIYSLVYHYSVHEEMKRHSGQGLGGGLGLVLAVFLGFVSPFVLSSEVGNLYERMGWAKPVSGATGLWAIPGFIIIAGPLVWLVKTNGALNAYWRSVGPR